MPVTVTTELTSDEVYTVWSMFNTGRLRLKVSGDYPEEVHHKEISTKLLTLRFDIEKETKL